MREEVFAAAVLFGSDEEQHWAQFLFADHGTEEDYLILEASAQCEPEDVKLGQAGVYAERAGESRSCYHGVEHVALKADRLEIAFNDTGRQQLLTDGLVIRFRLSADRVRELRGVLDRMFEETAVLAAP